MRERTNGLWRAKGGSGRTLTVFIEMASVPAGHNCNPGSDGKHAWYKAISYPGSGREREYVSKIAVDR